MSLNFERGVGGGGFFDSGICRKLDAVGSGYVL